MKYPWNNRREYIYLIWKKYPHASFEASMKFGYFSKAKSYTFSNVLSLITNIGINIYLIRILIKVENYSQLKYKYNILS